MERVPISEGRSTVSICLNMIVKNESKVIERCLHSVKAIISAWVIVDTGSTDGTQEIIRNYLAGIPGELYERPWVNFAHNRTEALTLAKGKGDYLLIIDADEVLVSKADFQWPFLTADAYHIETRFSTISYMRLQLVSNRINWRYVGVLHEYIFSDQAKNIQVLTGIYNIPHTDGARSSDPNKFKKDALLLESTLLEEPDNERYVFYLAQSYRDAGDWEQALRNYQKRVEMGGWAEEVFFSLYQIAHLYKAMKYSWEKVKEAYLKAFQFRPSRAEPLYEIALHYRKENAFQLAFTYAQMGESLPIPKDILFVKKQVYEYLLPMELAISAYWIGRHSESIRANNKILRTEDIPANIYNQTLKNRKFSLDAIYPVFSSKATVQHKIKVFIPFYNPGNFLDNCVSSLLTQDYDHFEMIFIDDASTDDAYLKVPVEDSRVTLIRNEQNLGGARNIHSCLTQYCEPDDIYVQVDGDDWLACNDALSYINNFYNTHQCWVMYGQFRYADGSHGWAIPFAGEADFRNLRNSWVCPAIRTFKARLYHRIGDQDPDYSCMKDRHANWFREAMDVALIYPIFELAGFDKVRFNDRILYVYNDEHPLNVHKTRRGPEVYNHIEISSKRPFAQLPY